ncbi:unnamed protein product [Camellia sinensis]
MGSKSFQAAMYKEGTAKVDIVDFYKDSHWSKRKADWIAPICGELHVSMPINIITYLCNWLYLLKLFKN